MKALTYLILRQGINFLKGLLKKPLITILYIVLFGFIIVAAFMSGGDTTDTSFFGVDILAPAVLLFFFGHMYITLRQGLTKGATVFGMEDVNLLFTAPFRSQSLLLYGVVRQMSTSLLILFVLGFQITNLRNLLNMSIPGIVALFICWFLLSVIIQVLALCLGALLGEKPGARSAAQKILLICAVAVIAALGLGITRDPSIAGALTVLENPLWRFIPLGGWLAGAVVAANAGQPLVCAGGILASLLLGGGVFAYTWRKDPDYYEDVLDVTLEKHETAQMKAEGRTQDMELAGRKIKVGRAGLSSGQGASAFFYKHLLEQRRQGFTLFDSRSLILIVTCGFMAFIMGLSSDGDGVPPEIILYTVIGTLLYMQFIFNAVGGKFTQEALKPYLYMTPCSPRMKIFMCNLLPALKALGEGLICCVGVSLYLGLPLWQGILAGALSGGSSMLFAAGGLLADLLLGEKHSKFLAMTFYFLSQGIVALPAIILFIVLVILVPALPMLPYIAALGYGALATTVLLALLGGLLHNPETTA